MSDDRLERFTEAVLGRIDYSVYSPGLASTYGKQAADIAFAAVKQLDRLESEESHMTAESFLAPQDEPTAGPVGPS